MINVKAQVYEAIRGISANVSDGYPSDWATFPAIQYTEEDNSVWAWADDQETASKLVYRIDIWDNASTSAAAMMVDAAIAPLGLRRTFCQDVADPSGLRHKVMRYEGVIDTESERVYQLTL